MKSRQQYDIPSTELLEVGFEENFLQSGVAGSHDSVEYDEDPFDGDK